MLRGFISNIKPMNIIIKRVGLGTDSTMEDDEDKHFHSLLRLFSSPENSSGHSIEVSTDTDHICSVTVPSTEADTDLPSRYLFDAVTKMDPTPKLVYKENVMSLVGSVLQGFDGALISLGLESSDHLSFILSPKGILYEAASYILRCIKNLQNKGMSRNLTVPCSYVLIANEKVHDLLRGFGSDDLAATESKPVTVSDFKIVGSMIVEAQTSIDIANMLQHGSKIRDSILLEMIDCGVYHCAFTIGIEYSKFGSMLAPISGKLTTVAMIIPDNVNINALGDNVLIDAKSIAVLNSVVSQVAESQTTVNSIPYKDSLLTTLLQAAFGGNCKTLLMLHTPKVVPSKHSSQVCSVLEFGSRTRTIQNKPDKTELAEKALMDAYMKELRKQVQGDGNTNDQNGQKDEEEEEIIVAQALASAVKDGFIDDESEESEGEGNEVLGASRRRISLKSKKRKKKQALDNENNPVQENDITVDALVALIQDPDNGVPRASQSALVNVQIHRGKGSVFSGVSIIQWLVANIDGVNNVKDAEQLGQVLLDKGAIFHSDGSSLFLNSENLFYYARDPLFSVKTLSIEEIRALLAPPQVVRPEPKVQQITIATISESEEIDGDILEDRRTGVRPEKNEVIQEEMDQVVSEGRNDLMLDDRIQEKRDETVPARSDVILKQDRHEKETPDNITPKESNESISPETSEESYIRESVAAMESNSSEKTGQDAGSKDSSKLENSDKPNVQDLQDIDLVTLERSTNYPHPLHFASATGKEAGVIQQLIMWYGVDCVDGRNRTPLMFAALGNKASVCKVLIKCGAVVDKREKSGLTAVHVACYHGSSDALKVLLSNGANTTIIDGMFQSVFHWSIVPSDQTCLKILTKQQNSRKSIEEMVDKHGLTPLHWAIFYNHPEHLKLLIKGCRSLLQLDSKGRTLLTYAIRRNALQCIEVLATSLECGGTELASAPDRVGLTPLHHASVESSPFHIAYLCDFLKDKNSSAIKAIDSEGRTPLHYATLYQKKKNVQILLQFGADRFAKDNGNKMPLELVQQCYQQEVDEKITRLLQDGVESEIDLQLILTDTCSQYLVPSRHKVANPQSKTCIIL